MLQVQTISRKDSDVLSENPQRLYAWVRYNIGHDIVRPAWRHADYVTNNRS